MGVMHKAASKSLTDHSPFVIRSIREKYVDEVILPAITQSTTEIQKFPSQKKRPYLTKRAFLSLASFLSLVTVRQLPLALPHPLRICNPAFGES